MRCLFLIVFIFISSTLFSQITGKIKDVETGADLTGAVICHQTDSSISDENGRFTLLNCPENITELTVSHVGYKTRQFILSSDEHFQILLLEPDPYKIEEVTVRSSLMDQKLKTSVSSPGIVKSAILDIEYPANIAVSLNSIPGVFIAEGNKNTNRITIRGMGSRTPYSSNRIKAYLDEIPLTRGDGTTVIEDIDVSGISRMEVLKGPSSSIYGSGLGGTIRLYTDSPLENGFTLSGKSGISTFNSYHNSINLASRGDKAFINAGFNQFSGNGFRENSRYFRNNLRLNGSLDFDKLELNFYSLFIEVDAEIPSSLDVETFRNNPSAAAQNWLEINGKEQYSGLIGGLGLNYQLNNKINLKSTLFTNYRNAREKRPFNNLNENSINYGIRSQIGFNTGRIKALVGSELFTESYKWKIFETIEGESGTLNNKNREKREYLNIFALFKAKLSERILLESGMNINFLSYRLYDQFLNDGNDISGSFKYDKIISPRLGLIYNLNKYNFYGNIGHGFSHPSLEETLSPEGERNTSLQPEKAWNYELGMRGPLLNNRLYFDLAFYRIDLKNIIVTKRLTEEIFYGVNAGKTRHFGLELFSQYLVYQRNEFGSVFLDFSYSISGNHFLNFMDDGIDFSGNILPGIPANKVNTTLRAEHRSGLSLYLNYRNTGKQYLNDSNTSTYESYSVTDIKFQYSTDKLNHVGIKLFTGINNLFDKRYASMILVNAPSFGESLPRYYYPGQFRTFLFGCSIDIHVNK